jgi:hypothetical protein
VTCTFFCGARHADAGVATEPELRGRGLATASTRAWCAGTVAYGLVPTWTTSTDNVASQRLAERLGLDGTPYPWDLALEFGGPVMTNTPRLTDPRSRRYGSWAALAAVSTLLAPMVQACDDEAGPETAIYVTDARLLDQDRAAVLRNGFLPAGSADGPAVTVEESSTIINGGSLQVLVSATAQFEQLLVGVTTVDDPAAEQSEAGQVRGYYEIAMPEPASEATVVLTIAQALPVSAMVFDIAAVAGGTQGPASHQSAEVVAVGAGDVQVSVSWDADSDVDLHVVDPSGEEIYWGAMSATSGGVLDLDSNADCNLDNTRNENITFTDAPPGEYTVRVDYFKSCGVEQTTYVVTVQLPGQDSQVFNGTFTGDGDNGAEGSGELITSFTIS